VARAESGYNPKALSPSGALGLMQLMPATAQGLGVSPLNPAQAIDGAARILSGNLNRFGSVPLALAAYNAGDSAVTRYGGIPPYPETKAYVATVMRYLNGVNP
jgi:soluble lytic murein transglycosylase-like protein